MKTPASIFAIALFALCTGCSSFQRKWDAVGSEGTYKYASRWDGRWASARHKSASGQAEGGRLRCVIEPVAESGFLAHFHANWKIFAADYDVPFTAKNPHGLRKRLVTEEFSGTHELPKIFGGTYRYEARISGDRFSAHYDSSYDNGTFEMTRQLTNATGIH